MCKLIVSMGQLNVDIKLVLMELFDVRRPIYEKRVVRCANCALL